MRRSILHLLSSILLLVALGAPAAHLVVDARYANSGVVTNRRVALKLQQPGSVVAGPWLVAGDYVVQYTGTNGQTTFSNVLAGGYSLTIYGSPERSFSFGVPDTNGLVSVASLVGNTNVTPVYYTAPQVDALLGSGGNPAALAAKLDTNAYNHSLVNEISSARVGVMRSKVIRNTATNVFFYLPNTNGVVRSLFYTSPNFGGEGSWGVRTNLELRVFTDFGSVADFNAPDTNYLTCRIPLATWLGSRWFNEMSPHNYPSAPAIPTYMLNNHTLYWDINDTWAYNDFDSVGGGNINFFEFSMRLPMPFTNGIFVQFWKLDTNEPFTNASTFHHAVYEVGNLPVGLRGVRLRTQYTSGTYPAGSAGIPIATNISGAGELLAICADFNTPSNHVNTASVLENQWSYTVDGVAGDLTTGGEDLFMNGYYFSMTGPRVFANRGTTLLRTHPFYVSAYRQFSAADGIRWRSSAHWWYPWGGPTGNNAVHTRANLLSFYYNAP